MPSGNGQLSPALSKRLNVSRTVDGARPASLNRPAEALVAVPDPGRHHSVPVGDIIS